MRAARRSTGRGSGIRKGEGGAPEDPSESKNVIIQGLNGREYQLLRPYLSRVKLRKHQVLHEPKRPVEFAYFVEAGAVSVLSRTARDGAVEVGMVGRLGCVGVPVLLGTGVSPHRALVRIPGSALRIGAADYASVINELPALQRLVNHYIQAAIVQYSQVAFCNVRHPIQERLCRWLLLVRDRIGSDTIPVTHDLVSQSLGVRRAGITAALGDLESRGAIRRSRGEILIIREEELSSCACECYQIIRSEYERLYSVRGA